MSNCPGCGRKTVAASFRVGGGGGGGGGGDSDSGGGGGGGDESDGSDGWDSFMAAHRRKEDDDEKFCEDVNDIRDAKEDRKVALLLNGSGWMGDIRDELESDKGLMMQVERIIVKNMGMDYSDKDMFAFILRHLPSLKQLEFAYHHWGPKGWDAQFCENGLARLKNLESLELADVHLSDTGAPHLAKALAAMPKLKRLLLVGADRYDDDWGGDRKSAEKLTRKGYGAILDSVRGRLEVLTLSLRVEANALDGMPKLLEGLASSSLKELDLHVGEFRATDEQVAQAKSEYGALLRHFASCPQFVALTWHVEGIAPETALQEIGANKHLEKLFWNFDSDWSLEQFAKMLKIVYNSKITAFKQDGYLRFSGQEWWRIARMVKQFAKKKGWRSFDGDLSIYNRLTSREIEKVWSASRYATSDVSSDESPDNEESLFEEDNPRAAAAPQPSPGRGVPAGRAMPARVAASGRGAMPTPPGRAGGAPTPPGRGGVVAPARVGRGATPAPGRGGVVAPARGATPTPPARGATPTPPARRAAGAATGLSGRAAIAAARAPPPAAPAVSGGVAGNWKLKDKKSIKNEQEALDDAISNLKSKVGDEWTLVIDWESFGEATDGKEDREPGENVICRVVSKFISNDVEEFDSDVVDALNGLVESKCVTFTCVRQHSNSARATVSASANGVSIVWSADWWGYEYKDKYLCDWVLNNC